MEYQINKTEIRNINEKANSFSFRYGGVGTDVKLYWDTMTDLKQGIDAVITMKEYLAKVLTETTHGIEVGK